MNVLNQDELIDKTVSGNIPIDDPMSMIIRTHTRKKNSYSLPTKCTTVI